MKLAITSLTLIAAASLPAFANAGTETTYTEMMSAERGPHCVITSATVTNNGVEKKSDSMEIAVNSLVDSTADPVLASYYRDLYMAPIPRDTVTFVRTPDPYVDALSLAFYGTVEPDSRLVC